VELGKIWYSYCSTYQLAQIEFLFELVYQLWLSNCCKLWVFPRF
jgi:hypothetical protein